jgi:hypothetical protein
LATLLSQRRHIPEIDSASGSGLTRKANRQSFLSPFIEVSCGQTKKQKFDPEPT